MDKADSTGKFASSPIFIIPMAVVPASACFIVIVSKALNATSIVLLFLLAAFFELLLAVIAARRHSVARNEFHEFGRLLILGPSVVLPICTTLTILYSKALNASTIVALFVIVSSAIVLLALLALNGPLKAAGKSDLISIISLVIGSIGVIVGIISAITTV